MYKTIVEVGEIRRQGVIHSSIILMAAVFFGKAAGLVFKIFLANMLGGTGMGYFSSAYAVFTPLYALCAASVTPAVAQLVSENDARRRYENVRGVRKAALGIFVIPSLLCSVIPALFAGFITEKFIGNGGAAPAVAAILPCVFLGTVTAICRGYYEGLRNMLPTAVSQILESAVRVASGIGFAYAARLYAMERFVNGMDVFGVHCATVGEVSDAALPYISAAAVLGVTASELASFLYMIIRTRFGDGLPKDIAPDRATVSHEKKRLLRLLAPITTAAIVSSLAGTVDLYTIIVSIRSSLAAHPNLYAEKYADVIASGVSLKELPNYLYGSFTGLAATVFGLAPSLCSVFGKSALPSVSEAWARGDLLKVRREIRRVMSVVLFISIPAGLGLFAMSGEILSLLFASRAEEAAISRAPLAVMALGTAFATTSGAACSMLQAVGKPNTPVAVSLFGAFVRLGLNILLVPVPSLGLTGAAVASLVSGGAMCAWSVVSLYRVTGTRPKPLISAGIPALGGAISSAAAVWCTRAFSGHMGEPVLAVFSIIFAVITYIFFVILLDISTKNNLKKEIMGK